MNMQIQTCLKYCSLSLLRPNLVYVCQSGIHLQLRTIESVQRFASQVCLKTCDSEYIHGDAELPEPSQLGK